MKINGLHHFFTESRKKLLSNFISLSVLQGSNYILPLISVPYLVRVLGPEKFGLIAFAQAFVAYFGYIIEYGFNFTATKEISMHRYNKDKVNEIFSLIFYAKLALTLVAFLLFTFMIILFSKFRSDAMLYYVVFAGLVGNLFFFQWYFQGIEKMKFITILNVTAKIIFIIFIFIFVRHEQDYVLAALFNSSGFVLAGLISVYFVSIKFKIRIVPSSIRAILREISSSFNIFITQIAPTLYTTSNVFILGLMTNNTIVGYYSVGEKLVKAVQAAFNPISQTIFPHVSYLVKTSKMTALKFLRKVTIISASATLFFSIVTFFFAPQIVTILFGEAFIPAISVVKILAFLPFVGCLGNIFGAQIMINFNLGHIYAYVVSSAGVFNVILAIILIPYLKQNGIAASVISTETIVTILLFIVLEVMQLSPRKKNIEEGGE